MTEERFKIVAGLDKDEIGVGQMPGYGLGLVEARVDHHLLAASADHEAESGVVRIVGQFDGLFLEFTDLEGVLRESVVRESLAR